MQADFIAIFSTAL